MLLSCAFTESTKALREQSALLGSSPKSEDQVDSMEVRKMKDDMHTMKKKILGNFQELCSH